MPEYIGREKAIKKMCEGCNIDFSDEPCEPYDCRLHRGLREMPAADVVEVVRCKECLYKNEWANDGSYPDYNFCKHSGLWHLTDNHFCSYGEKKEGVEK